MAFSPGLPPQKIKKLLRLPEILSAKERLSLALLILAFIASSLYLIEKGYLTLTKLKPAFGGEYSEGVIGQPRLLNPVYASASDVDRDITELLFSGLMKYAPDGKIVPDLALNYEVKDGGKTYAFELRRDAIWQDNKPITANDVLFTIKTIQDPAYQSPIRANWLGVSAEKLSDTRIELHLPKAYSSFLESATVKILPKHLWEDTNAENFPLSPRNLQNAIGSGRYLIKEVLQQRSGKVERITLEVNPNYFGTKPLIKTINFYFFDSEHNLISAVQSGTIDGFAPTLAKNYIFNNFKIHSFALLRYFAVFFNNDDSNALKTKEVREALAYGTNGEAIIKEVFNGRAQQVASPILPEIFELAEPKISYSFNIELAKELLDKAGFKLDPNTGLRKKTRSQQPSFQLTGDLAQGSNGKIVEELQKCLAKDPEIYPDGTINGNFGPATKSAVTKFQEKYSSEILVPAGLTQGNGKVGPSTRKKLNETCFPGTTEETTLNITLVTSKESPLPEIAGKLKEQWAQLGVNLEIQKLGTPELIRDTIRPRDYEALLFGQILGTIPDPFPFWHSTQVRDPGLNLTSFESKSADAQLVRIREAQDPEEKKSALEKLQNFILEETPAIFVLRPEYLYFVSPKIKGIEGHIITDPAKRFVGIENWYIKTRRVFQ